MPKRRTHRSTHKSYSGKKKSLERLLSGTPFKILGIIFLLIGVYYLIGTSGILHGMKEMILSFLSPSESESSQAGGGGNFTGLLLYFLPVFFILGLLAFYAKRFPAVTYPLLLATTIGLFVLQFLTSVYFPRHSQTGNLYPNVFIADVFLFFTVLLLFFHTILHHKPAILFLTISFFYWSVLLFVFNVTHYTTWQLEYIIPFILIFSVAVAWVAGKIKQPGLNLLNFLFAIGFFGLFWLKKFVINSRPEFLTEFFIYSALLYVLFYAVMVYSSMAEEKPLRKWMQGTMAGLNLLFYGGTTAYCIIKFHSFGTLWIFVVVLVLFHLAGLYFLEKYKYAGWKLPYQIAAIILASLVLPLVLHQSMVLFFVAGLSVLLLWFAGYSKNHWFILFSLGTSLIMTLGFMVQWGIYYFPALLLKDSLPENSLIIHGILAGIVAVAALGINLRLLKKKLVNLHTKWISKSQNQRLLLGLFLFALFLTVSWMGIALFCRLSGSMENVLTAWFISGSIYFLFLISFFSGQESIFKRPLQLIAFLFALSYPLLVHLSMTGFRTDFMKTGVMVPWEFILHYIALAALIGLGVMIIPRFMGWFAKKNMLRQGFQLLTVLFLFFLVTSEYDNLSVLLMGGKNTASGDNILSFNLHLPYTVIFVLFSIFILVWATVKHRRFIRTASMVLLLLGIVKIFVFDFQELSDTAKTFIFIFMGILLLAFSFYYPKLLKTASPPVPENRHHTHGRHRLKQQEKAPESTTTPKE